MFIMNPDSVTVISLLLNTLNHTKMYHKETLFLSFFRFDRRSPKYVLLRSYVVIIILLQTIAHSRMRHILTS